MEGAHFLKTGTLLSLSEQQLVDCYHGCLQDEPTACDDGCAGGLPLNAMRYVKRAGLDLETDYPYKAVAGTCEESKKTNGSRSYAARTTISGFGLVSQNETQIAATLVKHGPLSIGIDAAWMQTYEGGVACENVSDPAIYDFGAQGPCFGSDSLQIPLGFAPKHGSSYAGVGGSLDLGESNASGSKIAKSRLGSNFAAPSGTTMASVFSEGFEAELKDLYVFVAPALGRADDDDSVYVS